MENNNVDINKQMVESYGSVSLCTGYGGLERALDIVYGKGKVRNILTCEIEAYQIANLLQKDADGEMDVGIIWSDIKTLPFEDLKGKVTFLTAGFPCQSFSVAGLRKSTNDERHLYPYISDGIKKCKPKIIFFENVEGIISAKTDTGQSVLHAILCDMEAMGYRSTFCLESASATIDSVGKTAPHQRKRVFIVGISKEVFGPGSNRKDMENSNNSRRQSESGKTFCKNSSGKNSKSIRTVSTDSIDRSSVFRTDEKRSTIVSEIQRYRYGHTQKITYSRRICRILKRSNVYKRTCRKDNNKEIKNRTLVSQRQYWIFFSINRRLARNKTTSTYYKIRQRDDRSNFSRMGGKEKSLSRTNFKCRQISYTKCIRGRKAKWCVISKSKFIKQNDKTSLVRNEISNTINNRCRGWQSIRPGRMVRQKCYIKKEERSKQSLWSEVKGCSRVYTKLGYSDQKRLFRLCNKSYTGQKRWEEKDRPITKTDSRYKHKFPSRPNEEQYEWEEPRILPKSNMGRKPNGYSKESHINQVRIHRIRSCGNGVVPQTAARAFLICLDELLNRR